MTLSGTAGKSMKGVLFLTSTQISLESNPTQSYLPSNSVTTYNHVVVGNLKDN